MARHPDPRATQSLIVALPPMDLMAALEHFADERHIYVRLHGNPFEGALKAIGSPSHAHLDVLVAPGCTDSASVLFPVQPIECSTRALPVTGELLLRLVTGTKKWEFRLGRMKEAVGDHICLRAGYNMHRDGCAVFEVTRKREMPWAAAVAEEPLLRCVYGKGKALSQAAEMEAAWRRISGEAAAEEKEEPPGRRGDVVTALRLLPKMLWFPSKHLYYRSSVPVSRLIYFKIQGLCLL